MARIEWVKLRLNNWALWKDREQSGGLGWHSSAAFLADTGTIDRYRESVIPIDDVDASVTNTAVESLRPTRPHLYETLQCIYPMGLGIKETCRRMARAESTIKAQLEQADRALADWFTNRSEQQQKKCNST